MRSIMQMSSEGHHGKGQSDLEAAEQAYQD
jgi:hypothetical protein